MMPGEDPKDARWVADEMPILITFNVSTPSDGWLRSQIRGMLVEAEPQLQQVIVQGSREADRVCAALALRKYHRHLPYGGSSQVRLR